LRNEVAELLAPLIIPLTPLEISGNEITLSTVTSSSTFRLLVTTDSPATTESPVTKVLPAPLPPPSPVTKVNVFTALTGGSS